MTGATVACDRAPYGVLDAAEVVVVAALIGAGAGAQELGSDVRDDVGAFVAARGVDVIGRDP